MTEKKPDATFTVADISPANLEAAFLGMTIEVTPWKHIPRSFPGSVTITHEDGTEETLTGTWTQVFHP